MKKRTSTIFENQQTLHAACDAVYALSQISGRWKLSILTSIQRGENRFSLLETAMPSITERILALQLSDLETAGLIVKITDMDRNPHINCQTPVRQ